jgi:VanZ family protein
MTRAVNLRWGLVTVIYLAAVYALSSVPDFGLRRHHPNVLLLSNLSHAPIYAGLAYCVLRSVAGRRLSREHYVTTFIATTAAALFDEWHQSFVPGRTMSGADLLVDISGITTALVLVRLRSLVMRPECEAK